MLPTQDAFEFDYYGRDIVYGRECISRLETYLAHHGLDRALIVCGSNVGANTELMEPLIRGLGDRLKGIFDETTPDKLIETTYDGIRMMQDVNADVLIGVGGGSSLDITRQMSVFNSDGRSITTFQEMAREGRLEPPKPNDPLTPLVVIPTTFAGADISSRSVVKVLSAEESPTGQTITSGGTIEPIGMFYDPDLFDTTPMGALAGSAMNGFNKGLERIYSDQSTPLTDATAIRGLRMMHAGLPNISNNPTAMERAVIGIILVQFVRRLSVIHAFAHGYTRRYSVQQGEIHGILAPHVLRYIFERVHGRREVIAEGLNINTESVSDDEVAEMIIREVTAVRDALELPTHLRQIDTLPNDDFTETAEYIMNDEILRQGPEGLDLTIAEVENVLHGAW